ncbi:hypothetical protein [Vreelandella massiliensis]|uniref:hypothetical protein n=1 Tax=Vreelandella massiliensis TaxID=1816686 RepID=UPI00096A5E63|nr:hypothetical protein [Halomonas massiliensis]
MDMPKANAPELDPQNPKHTLPPGYRVVESAFGGFYFEAPVHIGGASDDFKHLEDACQKARGHYRRWRGTQRQRQKSTQR